jgi:hypothetical protein
MNQSDPQTNGFFRLSGPRAAALLLLGLIVGGPLAVRICMEPEGHLSNLVREVVIRFFTIAFPLAVTVVVIYGRGQVRTFAIGFLFATALIWGGVWVESSGGRNAIPSYLDLVRLFFSTAGYGVASGIVAVGVHRWVARSRSSD